MKVGDCYIQIEDTWTGVFRITEVGDQYVETTDIFLDKDSMCYTFIPENYSIELMESRIPILPELFDDLLALLRENVEDIRKVVNDSILPTKLDMKAGRSYVGEKTLPLHIFREYTLNDT